MLFALVVMAGVLLLTMVVNNRRQPSRWDRGKRRSHWDGGTTGDGSTWVFGGDVGPDCGADGGGAVAPAVVIGRSSHTNDSHPAAVPAQPIEVDVLPLSAGVVNYRSGGDPSVAETCTSFVRCCHMGRDRQHVVMRELDRVHRGMSLEPPFGMALHPPGPNRRPIPCTRCGKPVKLTGERDRLVFYICESCGTTGAFAVSSKDS